jgi:hypothetical protein
MTAGIDGVNGMVGDVVVSGGVSLLCARWHERRIIHTLEPAEAPPRCVIYPPFQMSTGMAGGHCRRHR